MRPASTAFVLLLDLMVVLTEPLLLCGVLAFRKEPEEVVALEAAPAAEAISRRFAAGRVAQEASKELIDGPASQTAL